jgi:hypothetical protein
MQIYGDPDEMGATFLADREETPIGYMGEFGRAFKNIGKRTGHLFWSERNDFLADLTMHGKGNKNRGVTINTPDKDWDSTAGPLYQLNKNLRSVKKVEDKGVEGYPGKQEAKQRSYDRAFKHANKNVETKKAAVEKKILEHEEKYDVNLSLVFNSKTGLFEVKLAPLMNAEQQQMLASGSI